MELAHHSLMHYGIILNMKMFYVMLMKKLQQIDLVYILLIKNKLKACLWAKNFFIIDCRRVKTF